MLNIHFVGVSVYMPVLTQEFASKHMREMWRGLCATGVKLTVCWSEYINHEDALICPVDVIMGAVKDLCASLVKKSLLPYMCVCVCVCVCVTVRERERERECVYVVCFLVCLSVV